MHYATTNHQLNNNMLKLNGPHYIHSLINDIYHYRNVQQTVNKNGNQAISARLLYKYLEEKYKISYKWFKRFCTVIPYFKVTKDENKKTHIYIHDDMQWSA